MGYEMDRFPQNVSQEFICSICLEVFSDPVSIVGCQHIFCRMCIMPIAFKVERSKRVCPIDRKPIKKGTQDAPRYFVNLWNELQIKCKYSAAGCEEVTTLENLDRHAKNCKFNQVMCHGGCGYRGQVAEDHNCIDYLKHLNQNKEEIISSLYKAIDQQKELIQGLESELQELKKNEPSDNDPPLEKPKNAFGRFRSSFKRLSCVSTPSAMN